MRSRSTLSAMTMADAIGHAAMFELLIIVAVTIRAVTLMRPASASASADIITMAAMVLAVMDLLTTDSEATDSEVTGLEVTGLEAGLADTAAVTTTELVRGHSE